MTAETRAPQVRIDGPLAAVTFDRFDLAAYGLFLRAKKLPESQLSYDREADAYTLTTPARFAPLLGAGADVAERPALPLAPHLFDYQRFCVEQALAAKRHACWADCVAGETRIEGPDGAERIDVLAERGLPIRVWALSPDGSRVAAMASAPFRKGRTALYTVSLSDGRSITVTGGHRFLTPDGWQFASSLRAGSLLAVSSQSTRRCEDGRHASEPPASYSLSPLPRRGHERGPSARHSSSAEFPERPGEARAAGPPHECWPCPNRSIAGPDLGALRPSAPDWTRTLEGCPVRCSTCCHRCGQPLRSATNSDPVVAPLRADARGPGRLWSLADAPGHTAARSRLHRGNGRPSTTDWRHRGMRAAGDAGCRLVSWRPTLDLSSNRDAGRFSPSANRPQLALESSPSGDQSASWPRVDTSFRTVVGIEYSRTDDYFDLHVPGYENYLANGIWHHNTGLGKSAIFLEWARQVVARTGGKVLILSPLAVIPQTQEMARTFYGDDCDIPRLDSREDLIAWCAAPGHGVRICNYDKLIPGQVPEFRYLAGLVCDESSVLKTGGGVIKWNLIHSAKGIEYKLSCTATPAPNDTMEYASQASFLEKLRNEGEVIWTYFARDKQGEWRVKPHAREAFYRFMASWSIYMRDPARFGFADILRDLPAPELHEERLAITPAQQELAYGLVQKKDGGLFLDDRLGVVERSKLAQLARGFLYDSRPESRGSVLVESRKPPRVAELVRQEVAAGRQVLVWTVFDQEGQIIRDLLEDAPFEVGLLDGQMAEAKRLALLERFRAGDLAALISKPQLIGYGLNLQHCRAMVFSGFDDSFERMYQAIRRAYRFGQTETVRVFVPYIPELEGVVYGNIRQKEARFNRDVADQEARYREALEWLLPHRGAA